MKQYIYQNKKYSINERNESAVHHSIGDIVNLIGYEYNYKNLVVYKIEHTRNQGEWMSSIDVSYYLTEKENYTWQ